MVKPQLIVVSNRLPVSVSKVNDKLVFSPSQGGLATAMSSLGKTRDYIWIGWPGINSDDLTPADRQTIRRELKKLGCYPVFLTAAQIHNFYDGYSNATIWPLFHYFQSLAAHEDAYWTEYQKVNQIYAAAVLKHATAESQIWIHDYHLMALPKLLREARPQASIGFFLHIPFPSYEIFRLLPQRRQIVEGLLGADLVGFHTYDYGRHFLSAVLRTLGYDNEMSSVMVGERLVRVDVFPIGIDYEKFASASVSPKVKQEIQALADHYDDQKMILSVDRLDYSKGIRERLEAFDIFLERNPKWLKRITLVVVAVPSRVDIDAYQHMREEIERTVSRINGKYATMDWSPISYQYKNLPFEQLVALYARADIALITPLRDGMNLVAKEYVASKQERPGVLIISEMAGVADELPEATRVNPNDRGGLADAIAAALRTPLAEQRRRLDAMKWRLASYTVERWAADFIDQLSRTNHTDVAAAERLVSASQVRDLVAKYRSARRRLLLLDYDGTLTDFVPSFRPSAAKPSHRTLRVLSKLSSTAGNDVTIVSGRPRKALDDWFSRLPLSLAAEHGAWIKQQGQWVAHADVSGAWKDPFREILQIITERTPGALIEEKSASLVWHYRNVPPELAYVRKATLKHDTEQLTRDSDIGVFQGNKILEFKPASITKGAVAATKLAEADYDFILAIGDDYTDEDLFASLPETAYTIRVGLGNSIAKYRLPSVDQVLDLLTQLALSID